MGDPDCDLCVGDGYLSEIVGETEIYEPCDCVDTDFCDGPEQDEI